MYQAIWNIQNELTPTADNLTLKDYIGFAVQFATVVVGALAVYRTLKEYEKQGLEKRAEQYLRIRESYRKNKLFQKIVEQAHSNKDFSAFAKQQRVEYMAFFEDMQFLINSGLIKSDVLYYMFGSDIIEAWDSTFCLLRDTEDAQESDIREDPNFTLLRKFVEGSKEFKTSRKIAERIERAEL